MLAGAGGAGRALAFGARSRGARIIVFDVDYGEHLGSLLLIYMELFQIESNNLDRESKVSCSLSFRGSTTF